MTDKGLIGELEGLQLKNSYERNGVKFYPKSSIYWAGIDDAIRLTKSTLSDILGELDDEIGKEYKVEWATLSFQDGINKAKEIIKRRMGVRGE